MGPSQEEYDWLLWFYQHCDFGPGDEDVREGMKERYEETTGKKCPYRSDDE